MLLNAVAAIGFLGFRYGHPPGLDQDLVWTQAALVGVGLSPGFSRSLHVLIQ